MPLKTVLLIWILTDPWIYISKCLYLLVVLVLVMSRYEILNPDHSLNFSFAEKALANFLLLCSRSRSDCISYTIFLSCLKLHRFVSSLQVLQLDAKFWHRVCSTSLVQFLQNSKNQCVCIYVSVHMRLA